MTVTSGPQNRPALGVSQTTKQVAATETMEQGWRDSAPTSAYDTEHKGALMPGVTSTKSGHNARNLRALCPELRAGYRVSECVGATADAWQFRIAAHTPLGLDTNASRSGVRNFTEAEPRH